MDLRAVVGRNVREWRTAQGVSQPELAHRAGIHVTYLSGVENGRRNLTVAVLERLASALNVTEEQLVRR